MKKIKEQINKLFKLDTDSLKLKSIRSAIWSLLGRGGAHFIRLASNLILTRILFPEAFGLMAIANIVLLMVQLFAETGVQVAIIQNPNGDKPEFINTVWIINIIRGILLGLLIFISASLFSLFYNEPSLKGILYVMGIGPLILGFENPALPLLVRNFKVNRKVGMELSSQFMALITTIILAFILKSVYALAIGYTVSNFYRVIISYSVLKFRPRFKWDSESGKSVFNLGKFIFLNTLITTAVFRVDVLIVGKLLDMENLSFYNMGNYMGTFVFTFCSQVIQQSYLPAVSSVQTDMLRVQRIYQRTLRFFITLTIPASMVLIFFSYDFIKFFYDPRYQLAYIAMSWFALAGIFRIISNVSGSTFVAIGRPALETISMAIGFIVITISIYIGTKAGGLFGASCAATLSVSVIPVIESIMLACVIRFKFRTVISTWLHAIFLLCICSGLYLILKPIFINSQYYNIPFMLLTGLLCLLISGLVYRFLEGPNPFRDMKTY